MSMIQRKFTEGLDCCDPIVIELLKALNKALPLMKKGKSYSVRTIAKSGGYSSWKELDQETKSKAGTTFSQLVKSGYISEIKKAGAKIYCIPTKPVKINSITIPVNDPVMLEALKELYYIIPDLEVGYAFMPCEMITHHHYSYRKWRKVSRTVTMLVRDGLISDLELNTRKSVIRYQLSFPSNLFQV